MKILGVSDSFHDRSTCLFENGKVIRAIEEERLTRHKHAIEINLSYETRRINALRCIDYCLESVPIEDLDGVYVSSLFKRSSIEGKSVPHHVAHAASAFFPSPFEEAAILVLDGAGDCIEAGELFETVSYGHGTGNTFSILNQISGKTILWDSYNDGLVPIKATQNSLGGFYKIVSVILGMGHFGAGKTMGLASYGKHCTKIPPLENYISFKNGKIEIDNLEIYRRLIKFSNEVLQKTSSPEEKFEWTANLAFKAQALTEKLVIDACLFLHQMTRSKYLCLAGGVALNGVANFKILENTPFQNIFIQPAAGDNGLSIGAAFWGYHIDKKKERISQAYFNPYLGKTYTESEILASYQAFENELDILYLEERSVAGIAARFISHGKIIGWMQDGSEIGPRALGNRSILADPRIGAMKDILNSRVKHREHFRPFAPVVLEEYTKDYFEFQHFSPYMLVVPQVKREKQSIIPAVTHVDHSARLQTISYEQNRKFAELISEFKKITGVPIVLNTSFNDKGEPIVETPLDAFRFFASTDIDVLFIQNFQFMKKNRRNLNSLTVS